MQKDNLNSFREYLNTFGKLNKSFGPYSKMYSMTTENISGFLSNFDLNNKSVLTVAGSGDQMLNSYLLGAKNVTCFDINPLTKYHLDLKKSAIKNLDYEKFMDFFSIHSKKRYNHYDPLNSLLFDEVSKELDKDTYQIYDLIINYFIDKQGLRFYDFYYKFNNDLDLLMNMNGYLKPSEYLKLSEILNNKDYEFIESDIINLKENLNDKKFDFILLSNISDYINDIFKNNYIEEFRSLIDLLMDNLNEYGVIQIGYIYSMYRKSSTDSCFRHKEEREKVFTTDLFHSISVDSFVDDDKKDKVIIYQKY